MMQFEAQGRRRRRTAGPLARALGAACFAGATALSTGFVPNGSTGGVCSFYGASQDVGSAARIHKATAGRQRSPFPMSTAATGRRGSTASFGRAEAPTADRRSRRPPLTVEEERVLLAKIQRARSLRELQKSLAMAGGGGLVTPEAWALEAGLGVDELARLLSEGLEAKQALVERNLPMVVRLVEGQYRWRVEGGYLSTADLLQEGAYALGVAADRFNPALPNRFLTYALYIVRDSLDTALANGSRAISVPATALKEVYRARRALTAELGRQPTEDEVRSYFVNGVVVLDGVPTAAASGRAISRSSDVEQDQVHPRIRGRRLDLLAAVQKATSLDKLISDSEGNTIPLIDTLPSPHGDPLRMPGCGDIALLMPKVLTRREAELVTMACGLGESKQLSMTECSQRLSMSAAKTKTMFETSLNKLRKAATAVDPKMVMMYT